MLFLHLLSVSDGLMLQQFVFGRSACWACGLLTALTGNQDCLEVHTCIWETLTLFGGKRVFFFRLCLLQLCLVETGDFSHVRLVRHFGCERRERYLSTQVWPFLSAIVLIMQPYVNSHSGAWTVYFIQTSSSSVWMVTARAIKNLSDPDLPKIILVDYFT